MKPMNNTENVEVRNFNFEIRANQNEEHGNFIEGRAIVYNEPTDMGWYREIIEAGALKDTDLRDVRLLVNHNTDMIPLARSRNNNANSTMQLSNVDGEGLDIRADLDVENNADAKALYSAISRGDISGMSFMFVADGDRWENIDTDYPTRYITSIRNILEVSACTFPAYAQTSLEARGLNALDNARESLDSAIAEKREIELAKAKAKFMMGVS